MPLDREKDKFNGQFDAVKSALGRARSCFTSQKDSEMINVLLETHNLLTDLVQDAADKFQDGNSIPLREHYVTEHTCARGQRQPTVPNEVHARWNQAFPKSDISEKGPRYLPLPNI